MEKVFREKSFISLWFQWHFFCVPKKIIKGWKNFLIFNLDFFSIRFLFKTIFSYWHKYRWCYDKSFSFKNRLNVLFSNFISRFLGFLIRILIIIFGLAVEFFIILIGFFILIAWVLIPFLLMIGIIFGIILIRHGKLL
jgi:hypothetical protein